METWHRPSSMSQKEPWQLWEEICAATLRNESDRAVAAPILLQPSLWHFMNTFCLNWPRKRTLKGHLSCTRIL
ncbi:hypothetical protein AV530_003827 [Patagioenas fasciata monilis]|uniref:Uncharacterized protein n=1 Tax=Patagioenas fasciata monilis TaxID=372326 RepID=A0A1V4KYM5_PATFA|nr:hypothetical protein AV530_003827 [Patagioenas fasciata monilis]